MLSVSWPILATSGVVEAPGYSLTDPYTMIVVLVFLSLAPFFAMMVTSYLKLVVVFNLIRNALGIQQIPPTTVLNGLAMVVSFYIMAPVAQDTYDIIHQSSFAGKDWIGIKDVIYESKGPLQNFLYKHSAQSDRKFFVQSAKLLWPEHRHTDVKETDLIVLIPAFTVSELGSAFQIGFLVYLPFVMIDIIVSNILLALGMMMISPTVISLPFKLLLFVLVSGWSRLIQGIVLTYK
ncbi:MAG TPA: type III secretion system export apparatus subunit SctR [Opitutales bacterium]|nr:type III secretion system export apparatus subunit SctR [Opitutales bacterium]